MTGVVGVIVEACGFGGLRETQSWMLEGIRCRRELSAPAGIAKSACDSVILVDHGTGNCAANFGALPILSLCSNEMQVLLYV